jgi:adenylate cyclase
VTKTLPHRGFRFVADVISASERAHDTQTVLPFSNLGVDRTYEFLADGLTEDVVSALSKLRGFFGTDRSTTFALKSEKTDPRKVAEEMGVLYILLGSVQSSGVRIRVNPRLLDTETGSQL